MTTGNFMMKGYMFPPLFNIIGYYYLGSPCIVARDVVCLFTRKIVQFGVKEKNKVIGVRPTFLSQFHRLLATCLLTSYLTSKLPFPHL